MRRALLGEVAKLDVNPVPDLHLREVMNIRQASEYLGVSPDTLYKYLSEGKVPAFKLGNRWRFKKTTLDRWMEHQSQSGEPRNRRRAVSARRV